MRIQIVRAVEPYVRVSGDRDALVPVRLGPAVLSLVLTLGELLDSFGAERGQIVGLRLVTTRCPTLVPLVTQGATQ